MQKSIPETSPLKVEILCILKLGQDVRLNCMFQKLSRTSLPHPFLARNHGLYSLLWDRFVDFCDVMHHSTPAGHVNEHLDTCIIWKDL